ncbi:MAG TPA: radical SAM protein [Thermoplasmata archaeon]|nr:radical SAM protein [Thermoplasmata archaeon]
MSLSERPCGSLIRGQLPVGCAQCTEGAKMVLFVTGLCSFHCFYCPVSDEKMYRDVVFADEKRVESDADVIEEARAIRAKGAGITGGDPLETVDRTAHYIRLLKEEFGPGFHTHLYTMSTDPEKLRTLAEAGLDEIRFHVPPGLWSDPRRMGFQAAVRRSKELGMTVGLEVPLIPEREADLVRLIEWAESEGLAFVNLDEMEFSDANFARMKVRGYATKHELAYGVQGADQVALRLLERPWKTTVHYCTSGYKDAWQLRTRIKRRAENVARPWDVITDDGTLVKGVIEGDGLDALVRELAKRHHVPKKLMGLDAARRRIEIAPWILEEIAPSLGRPSFVVEEYPTADGLEVERVRLP